MIPSLGAYYRPGRLEEALQLLREEPGARVLAGGTDLLLETDPVHALIDISRLGWDAIRVDDAALRLGSTTRIEDLVHDSHVRAWADGVLVGAALNFGTLQVRNVATVGGNVAHALPAADLVPALIALDAELHLARLDDGGAVLRRTLPLDGFATAPFVTQLHEHELIVEIHVPVATRACRAHFRKIGRVLKDLAQVNTAVALHVENDHVREARIVVGAVHPTVTRVVDAEREISGANTRAGDWTVRCARAVQAVRDFVRPISDVRASAAWRRHVCGVLVQRSLDVTTRPEFAGRVPCYEDGPLYRVGVSEDAR